jgi:hypothetical protein
MVTEQKAFKKNNTKALEFKDGVKGSTLVIALRSYDHNVTSLLIESTIEFVSN